MPKSLPVWFDPFSMLLMAVVLMASLLPVQGQAVVWFDGLMTIAIAVLFFLHGAKLSPQAMLAGLTHWRLHALILGATFMLFPLLGWLLKPLLELWLTPTLYLGILYLCLLPSTVQSSIAFTSLAKGNVAAALASASTSNLLGIFLTPLLVSALMTAHPASTSGPAQGMLNIVLMLLLPFVLGQLCRRQIFPLIRRFPLVVRLVDQGSIMLVVYGAFSEAINQGLWQHISAAMLLHLLLACAALLAIVMVTLTYASRKLGFSKSDEIAIVFCGSKKTLASGLPMAKILFLGQPIGLLILPLMVFHQMQLMVCSLLAARYARQQDASVRHENT